VASLNKGLLKRCKARCIRKACRVTVVSEQLKSKLQELAPDADPDVISMGVDTEKFGRQHYVPDYFGQNGKKVVLFVGRLAEKKGVTYLIEAMKEVDAVLAVAGDGPLRKELEEQAVPIRDKVMFLGAKTHDELKILYASADIFAAPSVTAEDGDQEGMPTTIMEAMASGIPIVSTKSSGIMQLIDDGENGLLCEEKNISRLAEKRHHAGAEEGRIEDTARIRAAPRGLLGKGRVLFQSRDLLIVFWRKRKRHPIPWMPFQLPGKVT